MSVRLVCGYEAGSQEASGDDEATLDEEEVSDRGRRCRATHGGTVSLAAEWELIRWLSCAWQTSVELRDAPHQGCALGCSTMKYGRMKPSQGYSL